MRFRVAVEHQALVFDYQESGDIWGAQAFQMGALAPEAECKAIRALNCIGRASMIEGKLTWDISRDDLSVDDVIRVCGQVAFHQGSLSNYQVLSLVGKLLPSILCYDRSRLGQVGKELRRSFMGNMTRRPQ